MKQKIPHSPFSTHLSGSAKETELRLRNIFQWKKKRPPVVLFVLILVVLLSCFGLFSCTPQAESPAVDDSKAEMARPVEEIAPDLSSSPSSEPVKMEREMAMEAFSAILSGSGEFVSAESGKTITIGQIQEGVPVVEGATVSVPNFSVVDMDADGVEELVLALMVNDEIQYGCEILRYHKGAVYGYTEWRLPMQDLKTDGTYFLPSTGSRYAVCTAEFDESRWNVKLLAEYRFVTARDDSIDPEYYINGEPATLEAWTEAYEQQQRKNTVRWYDLTCGWGGDLSKQPYVFCVENNLPAERRVYEEWSPLTAGQRNLLTRIPAEELPKEAVVWGDTVARKDIWEDTLVPLVYDKASDVTLYGVVGAEALWGRTMVMPQELDSDGLVLRVGERAVYYPFAWGGNHWYGGAPVLEPLDTDGDGRVDSAAVIPWAGRGVGFHEEVLYLIDLTDLNYQVVDFSQLNVRVWCDPTAKTATLTCGKSAVTVDTSAKEEVTRCTAMGQVMFAVEDSQIRCSVGLDFGGAVCYWAWANGVIRFADTGPCFTDIVLSDAAAVQNG